MPTERAYKAVPYTVTKHHDAESCPDVPCDDMPAYDERQIRYCIVSTETGEILDDTQGYGYRTAQKAYAGYGYKRRDKSKDKERAKNRRHIEQWIREHKSFVGLIKKLAAQTRYFNAE